MDSSIDNEEIGVDPVLQKLRDEALNGERVNYEAMVTSLCEQVQQVHSSYLFHSQGREALKMICQCISSTPADSYHVSWKDLAGFLGLSYHQIGCIENYHDDMTELTLKAFAYKADASLGRLADAFLQIKRFDCVAIAAKMFPAIAEFAMKDFAKRMGQYNCNYNSTDEENGKEARLIRPDKGRCRPMYPLKITLEDAEACEQKVQPPDFQKKKWEEDSIGHIERRIDKVRNVCTAPFVPQKNEICRKRKKIMLTYASDCEDIAKYVASQFRKERDNRYPCRVLLLNEHPEQVATNPYDFIIHQFNMADYIIPILSDGYFERLCDDCNNDSNQLDESNIKLLLTLMQDFHYYNKCINTKIRPIIPKRFQKSVFKNQHYMINPVFKPYVYDNVEDIENLVNRLATAKRIK